MKMTIGTNIKRLRTAKDITQEQLSVAMNVTCAAVSKWERGDLSRHYAFATVGLFLWSNA